MKIVYRNADGSVAVVIPAAEALETCGIETIALKGVPKGLPYWLVEDSAIPAVRTFRSAWEIEAGGVPDGYGASSYRFLGGFEKIAVNPGRAVAIAQEKIRQWRRGEFAKNDIALQNALADGDDSARKKAVARRDHLRDLPAGCVGKPVDELILVMDDLGIV